MTNIQYALAVNWGDDGIEFVLAHNLEHAQRLADSLYSGRQTWIVGREISPWRYAKLSSDSELGPLFLDKE